jgi:hypothetical protein
VKRARLISAIYIGPPTAVLEGLLRSVHRVTVVVRVVAPAPFEAASGASECAAQ